MEGIILAAGKGTRLRPITLTLPKPVVPIMGKPIAAYGIEAMKELNVKEIAVVVGTLAEVVKANLGNGEKWGVRLRYVYQEERLGIAHAIHVTVNELDLRDDFVVYLGDNIVLDEWPKKLLSELGADAIFFLTEVPNPSRFGVAVIEGGKVKYFIEKPKVPPSNLVLVGIYYFRDPQEFEECYSTLKPSWRGEYEITDIINCYLKRNKDVRFVKIKGWWKDAGRPQDLIDAMIMLMDYKMIRSEIRGEVMGEVKGKVIIEEGAVVEGKVYGPAYIGKNVYIGKEAILEHYVDLEPGSKVISGSLTRSLVLDNTKIELGKARLVDSVVGTKSSIRLLSGNSMTLRLVLGQESVVEST